MNKCIPVANTGAIQRKERSIKTNDFLIKGAQLFFGEIVISKGGSAYA